MRSRPVETASETRARGANRSSETRMFECENDEQTTWRTIKPTPGAANAVFSALSMLAQIVQ